MNPKPRHHFAVVVLWVACVSCLPPCSARGPGAEAEALTPPRVWIFCGLTGDEARRNRYLRTVRTLRQAFGRHFGVAARDMVTLFDRGHPPEFPACSGDALTAELRRMGELSGDGRPHWVFFLGHGASVKDAAFFHVPGRDLSARDLAHGLASVDSRSPLVLWLTMSASGDFVRALAGKHRLIVAACRPGSLNSETEFPHMLAEVLQRPAEADADGDRIVSVAEMVAAGRRALFDWYRTRELVCNESAVVDGNGDGHVDPSADGDDSRWARVIGLRYRESANGKE